MLCCVIVKDCHQRIQTALILKSSGEADNGRNFLQLAQEEKKSPTTSVDDFGDGGKEDGLVSGVKAPVTRRAASKRCYFIRCNVCLGELTTMCVIAVVVETELCSRQALQAAVVMWILMMELVLA